MAAAGGGDAAVHAASSNSGSGSSTLGMVSHPMVVAAAAAAAAPSSSSSSSMPPPSSAAAAAAASTSHSHFSLSHLGSLLPSWGGSVTAAVAGGSSNNNNNNNNNNNASSSGSGSNAAPIPPPAAAASAAAPAAVPPAPRPVWARGGSESGVDGAAGPAGGGDTGKYTPWRRWRKGRCTGNAPSPRTKFSSVVYENKMIVFGGGYQKEFYGDLYEYDLNDSVWRCIQTDAQREGRGPSRRRSHRAVLHNHYMIVFGGRVDHGRRNDLFVLDLDTYTWSERFPGGRAAAASTTATPPVLGLMGTPPAATMGVGGGGGEAPPLLSMDSSSNNSSFSSIVTAAPPRAACPPERAAHSAVSYKHYMVVFGGDTGRLEKGQEYLADLWFYDCDAEVWSEKTVRGDAPGGRLGHACALHGTAMYIFGGFNGSALNDMYVCDLERLAWRKVHYRYPFCPVSFLCMISEDPPIVGKGPAGGARRKSSAAARPAPARVVGHSKSALSRLAELRSTSAAAARGEGGKAGGGGANGSPHAADGVPAASASNASASALALIQKASSSAALAVHLDPQALVPMPSAASFHSITSQSHHSLAASDVSDTLYDSFETAPVGVCSSTQGGGGGVSGGDAEDGDLSTPIDTTASASGVSITRIQSAAAADADTSKPTNPQQQQQQGGSLLLWGGAYNDLRAYCTDLYRFDCKTEEFTPVRNVGDCPPQRLGHTMFLTEAKQLYIFGGCDQDYYNDTHHMDLGPMSLKEFARHAIHLHGVPYKPEHSRSTGGAHAACSSGAGDGGAGVSREAPGRGSGGMPPRPPPKPQGLSWVMQGLPSFF